MAQRLQQYGVELGGSCLLKISVLEYRAIIQGAEERYGSTSQKLEVFYEESSSAGSE
jgi:hypothetical protein